MSIDVNNYIEAALDGIREQIDEVNNSLRKILQDGPGYSQSDMDRLAELVTTVSDSVEILQHYNGQCDRIERRCWCDHPGCYEVQCRLCKVQRLCAEETDRRNLGKEDLPNCFRGNPLRSHSACWGCSLFRLCLEESRKKEIEVPKVSHADDVTVVYDGK
jgi:hypothetical protein